MSALSSSLRVNAAIATSFTQEHIQQQPLALIITVELIITARNSVWRVIIIKGAFTVAICTVPQLIWPQKSSLFD